MTATKPAVLRVLNDLQFKSIGNCKRCKLSLTRTHIVFGAGNPMADLLVVGEGPGEHEDLRGVPFVGPSGMLLDRILQTIGRDRSTVYVANCVKCRACDVEVWGKKNRPPSKEELEACSDFFDKQVSALPNLRLILAFGSTAAHRVMLADPGAYPMWKLRRKFLNSAFYDPKKQDSGNKFLGRDRLPLIVTYHPSYLLRTPEEKIKTFSDVLLAKKYLDASEEELESSMFDRHSADENPPRGDYAHIVDKRKYGHPKPFQKDKYSETLEAL